TNVRPVYVCDDRISAVERRQLGIHAHRSSRRGSARALVGLWRAFADVSDQSDHQQPVRTRPTDEPANRLAANAHQCTPPMIAAVGGADEHHGFLLAERSFLHLARGRCCPGDASVGRVRNQRVIVSWLCYPSTTICRKPPNPSNSQAKPLAACLSQRNDLW